jgi:hypothetical protein
MAISSRTIAPQATIPIFMAVVIGYWILVIGYWVLG